MNILFDVSAIFLFFVTIPTNVDSKILRVGHEFNGYFSIVDANSRITRNKVKETTAKDLRKCTALCLIEKKCLTFNYNENLQQCELLNISKFAEVGLLQSDEGWNHYETDDDEPNVGPFCKAVKPCPPYAVCEDTYDSSQPYKCSCREGFTGVNCTGYIGPGSSSAKPIQSCNLLLSKYKDIKSGEYYVQKKDKTPVKRNCTRKETKDGSADEETKPKNEGFPCKEGDFTDYLKKNTTCETSIATKDCVTNPDLVNRHCGKYCGLCGLGKCFNYLKDDVCKKRLAGTPTYCENAGKYVCRRLCNKCLAKDTIMTPNPTGPDQFKKTV